MDADIAIHKLRDIDIHGNTGEHICFVAVQMLYIDEEIDHVADGKCGCFLQIWAESHADIAGRSFRAGPKQMAVFMHDEFEGAGEEGFHSRNVYFSVALASMAIADFKERAFGMHRNV